MGVTIQTLDYERHRIEMWVENEHERSYRVNAVAKEGWTKDWIEAMPPDAVLYDVGSNVGSYTLIAAALRRTTVAIEPGFANYGKLCKNLALNNWLDRVLCLPYALGPANAIIWMQYRDIQPGAASHVLAQQTAGNVPLFFHRQMVTCYRLDDLIRAFGLPKPTHIKLDVDGMEEGVLTGAPETLKAVQSVMCEIQPSQEETVPKLLVAAGLVEVASHKARGIRYAEHRRVTG